MYAHTKTSTRNCNSKNLHQKHFNITSDNLGDCPLCLLCNS